MAKAIIYPKAPKAGINFLNYTSFPFEPQEKAVMQKCITTFLSE